MFRTSSSSLRILAMEGALITVIAGAGAYAWAGQQTNSANAAATTASQQAGPIAPEYHI
jgi:hypothetical protein